MIPDVNSISYNIKVLAFVLFQKRYVLPTVINLVAVKCLESVHVNMNFCT